MADIRIPNAALEAGARALREEVRRALGVVEPDPPEGPSPLLMEAYGNEARAAFLAMIKAWEGAKTIRDDGRRQTYAIPALILPLPTEASDE